MSSIVAFLVLAVVYYIGEFVGTKTKAWIPSVFVIASLFLFGYWTFFPKDIVALAGMGAPLGGTLVIMLCITHMGTIISIRQLLDQWKIICITLAGLAGMVAGSSASLSSDAPTSSRDCRRSRAASSRRR